MEGCCFGILPSSPGRKGENISFYTGAEVGKRKKPGGLCAGMTVEGVIGPPKREFYKKRLGFKSSATRFHSIHQIHILVPVNLRALYLSNTVTEPNL